CSMPIAAAPIHERVVLHVSTHRSTPGLTRSDGFVGACGFLTSVPLVQYPPRSLRGRWGPAVILRVSHEELNLRGNNSVDASLLSDWLVDPAPTDQSQDEGVS